MCYRIEYLSLFFRFYDAGVKSAFCFGMLNYDIMIVYDNFIDRVWELSKIVD